MHLIAAFIKDRLVGEDLVQLYLSYVYVGHLSDINVQDNKQRTPLHYAVQYNNVDVVKLLISKGADVRAVDKEKRTLLHYAARNTDVDVVKMIINTSGADVKAVDKNKWTPLHIAAWHPNADVIRALVEGGALVDARADYDLSLIHI